jgi:DNA-directed RNA polymerase specialized sigma24 family protein
MTRGSPDADQPLVAFHGPEELVPLWKEFVEGYTKGGTRKHNVENARLLEQMAFGDGGAAKVAALYADGDPAFKRLRMGVEDAARTLSARTEGTEMRPLHKAIVAALMDQWITLERIHGLYPRDSTPGKRMSRTKKEAAYQRTEAMLRTNPGALLAGVLRMAHDGMIVAEKNRAFARLKHGVADDAVDNIADYIFSASLLTYEPRRGAHFTTHVYTKLRYLVPEVLRQSRGRFGQRKGHHTLDTGLSEDVMDNGIGKVADAMIAEDAREQLRRAVVGLDDPERAVVSLRFGLVDGVCHEQEDIARQLALSQSRVQQIEKNAVQSLRRRYRQDEIDEAIHAVAELRGPPSGRGR